MQAVKAYYDDGKFVPFQPVIIPKGSQAIVTILDSTFDTRSNESRIEWLNRLEAAIELSMDEELPDWAFQRSKEMRMPLNLSN